MTRMGALGGIRGGCAKTPTAGTENEAGAADQY
jgi:hypothetical protein